MERVGFALRDEFGGIKGEQFDNRKKQHTEYYTVPLEEILDRTNAPRKIDYMSLDVEGAEFYVMEKFPFDKYRISVLTIERPQQELQRHLIKNGYEMVRIIARFGETLWIHRDAMKRLNVNGLEKYEPFPKLNPSLRDLFDI